MKKDKLEYYRLTRIIKEEADYNIIFGERSNGKTYSVLEYGLQEYIVKGYQMAILRRWDEDFRGKRGNQMFDAIVNNGLVAKYSRGNWDRIYYYSGKWYLAKYDEKLDKVVKSDEPFCYGFAISVNEHDKSTAYPKVKTILFDEMISRTAYLPDEFILFCNTLSTIIRERDNVKIFMLGNTINKYCPYFEEMGLKNVRTMRPGDIQTYVYGENRELKVSVEYTAPSPKGTKKSDKYFAFDNPKLKMITSGEWELAIYPHLPTKYTQKDIQFTYYIVFKEHILQCEIISIGELTFTYVHLKTTPLKYPDEDLIFSLEVDARPNWWRKANKPIPIDTIQSKIAWFYKTDKIFYQSNEVGEIMRNYLLWCNSDTSIK